MNLNAVCNFEVPCIICFITIPIGMLFMTTKKVFFDLIKTIRKARHPEEEVDSPVI